jgi:beta-lactamase superfamily II metal-dependent hydrolase
VYQRLVSNGVTIKESNYTCKIVEEDYFVGFLAPVPYGLDGSAYNALNLSPQPDSQTVYSVSAVIYLEYKGVRFLFTADAVSTTEQLIMDNYDSGVYDLYLGKGKVNLDGIDFLKVGRNGASDGTCAEFLSVIKPSNAVISVGENYYGHPAKAVVNRLQESNSEISFYLTNINGTVTVLVTPDGRYTVKTSN